MEVRTCDRARADWALTQMNLGYALEVPADKGGGRADYTAALDCYRAALEVFTPDRNRIEHDRTQRNLDRVIKKFADGR